jgi:hypothetical protein
MPLNVQVNRPPTLRRICKLCSVFPSSFLTPGISYAHARPFLLSSYNVARDRATLCWYKSSPMSVCLSVCLSLMECLLDAYENCFILDVVILTESIPAQVAGCEFIVGIVLSIPAMLLEVQL